MVSVWVEGIDELNTIALQLRAKHGRVGAQGAAVVRAAGHRVEATANLFCPVATGNLKSSIGPVSMSGDGRFGEIEAAVTAHAGYALFVEFGTENMAPHAFMGPALDRVGPEFDAAVKAISDPFD